MSDSTTCPECGGLLDLRSGKAGPCPACLLALGFDTPPTAPPSTQARSSDEEDQEAELPDRIGNYQVLELLGEGGMGTVYLAEQQEPIRRRVALKVVKRGMDTKRVLARFEAERQTLAMMSHPGIAQVFEAKDTGDGRPYFSMEHVEGERITKFSDRSRLTTRQRLRLFLSVCEAVQHAHQKGIIHRDLKPSNILVSNGDGDPKPKIIDFGIAKATDQRAPGETIVTEMGVAMGTPDYMSPEQSELSPLGVDTRADIYSLGVILYELLSGQLPFDFRGIGPEEARRRIREEEPPTPSDRVRPGTRESTGIAALRRVDAPTLRRELHGDLDWITLKALEKSPERRYASAAELAGDIRRYLDDEPVEARPPSTGYRLGKFVRRNRLLAVSLGAIVLALAAGVVVSSVFAVREAAQRRTTERARADLESVVQFQARMLRDVDIRRMGQRLVADLREQVVLAADGTGEDNVLLAGFDRSIRHLNPADAAREILDREILERASAAIDEEFAGRPEIAASLRTTIGETYRVLGMFDRARRQLEEAAEMREQLLGPGDPDTLETIYQLGRLSQDEGDWETAASLYQRAYDGRLAALGPDDRATLVSGWAICGVVEREGKMDEAEDCMIESLAGHRRVLGNDDADTLNALALVCIGLQRRGRHEEAEPYCVERAEGSRRVHGPDHRMTLSAVGSLGTLKNNLGDYVGAEPYIREMLEGRSRIYGDTHHMTVGVRRNLGDVLLNQGRHEEAEHEYLAALDGLEKALGEDNPATAYTCWTVGRFYKEIGDLPRAETYYRSAWERYSRRLGPEHLDTTVVRNAMADTLHEQGLLLDAEEHYREILRILQGLRPRGGEFVARGFGRLGSNLAAQERFDEAEEALLAGHAEMEARGEDASEDQWRDLLQRTVDLYEAWSRPDDAAAWRLALAGLPEEEQD